MEIAARPLFRTEVGRDAPGRAWTVPFAFGIHGVVLAAVVVLPLLADEPLPEGPAAARAFFALPAFAPAPPPPPPPPASARPSAKPRAASTESAQSFAPIAVPEEIPPGSALDLGVEGGVPGGVEGGVPGGVVGGVVGGLGTAAPPPPAPTLRVGGGIREPRKVKHVAPAYPRHAREARIQGVVILECTISPLGRVEDVRVLRGVRLLDEAAVEAVQQWVYSPTLVDGVPVPVLMTVTVNFSLRDARSL
jgi:protein TonB